MSGTSSGSAVPNYIVGVRISIWRAAWNDVASGLANYRLWMFLGWQDIRQRYRRSVLGPFWLTLSTAIMVSMMSVLYGRLFKMPMDIYAPFLASGTIIWTLIATLINEGCLTFMAADSMIKQVRMPLTLHACRMVWRNLIVFCHNAVILVPVYLIFGKSAQPLGLLTTIAALGMIAINGLWVGMVLGMLCARFRDIGPIVTNLVQVAFFITPIMWLPSILEGRGMAWWLLVFNPFYHIVEIARAPILGDPLPATSWKIVILFTACGVLTGMAMLGRFRNRIAYWL